MWLFSERQRENNNLKSSCMNGVNFLRRLALQKKNPDDSSRLDVIEIARIV